MLVILDNVRLDTGPWSEPKTLTALLDALAPATLIMTTRSRSALTGFASIAVESLPEDLAIRMMTNLRAQHGQPSDRVTRPAIARELGGLPFAIERAIELMQSEHYSAQSLLLKLRHEGRDPDGRLAKLLDWSYEPLDDDAKAVLVAMGQLPEAPAPEVLLAGLLPQNNAAQGIKRLIRSGLLERSEERPGVFTYHQHSLLWEWASKLGSERHQADVAAIQQHITASLKTHDEQVAPLLITHLLTAQRLAEEQKQWDRVVGLMWGTNDTLSILGYWGAEKDLLQRALKAAQKGTDRKVISSILNNLGEVALREGDYKGARKYLEQSLDLAQAVGDEKLIVSMILNNLGNVACQQGNHTAARSYYQQSLDIARALGHRHLIAKILNELGEMARLEGHYQVARRFFEQSLDLAQTLGYRRLISGNLLHLGNMAGLQGDYAAARKYYQQSLDLAQAQGDRHLIATILNNLGEMARREESYEVARRFFEQSLNVAQTLGARQLIADILGNLGLVARSQGDDEAARRFFEQSLDLAQALGDRQGIASVLNNLGLVAESQGDYEAARKYYEQSLDLAQTVGVRDVIGRVLWGQARVAANTGRKAEARQLLDHAIQIFAALGDPALADAQKRRAALGAPPDPVQCRKTCDDLQAKGELAVPIAECVQKLCAD